MPYDYQSHINVFNVSGRPFRLIQIEQAYKHLFEDERHTGVKPYINIYLLKTKKNIPISIAAHRTSRILDCSKYESSLSPNIDGFNIFLSCYEFVDNDYLSWLACKCMKHIEILLNKENYEFLKEKDELSKKRVKPQKELGICDREWRKNIKDSISIEIISTQFAKDITGKHYTQKWKREQLSQYYDLSSYNPAVIKSKEGKDLMKTLDIFEMQLVETFTRKFFLKYYEVMNHPEDEEWLRDKAWRLFKLSRFDESIEVLNLLIEKNSHNEEYHRLKGTCLLYKQEFKDAIECLNTAIFNEPEKAETHYIKANCFYKLNNFENTLQAIDKAIKLAPDNAHYLAVKGLSHFSLKQYEPAIEVLTKSLKQNPQQAKSWCLKGFSLLYTLNFEKAEKSFDKALIIKPTYLDAILGKAFVLKRMKKFSEALEYFSKLEKIKPDDEYIHKCRRECILEINKTPEPVK